MSEYRQDRGLKLAKFVRGLVAALVPLSFIAIGGCAGLRPADWVAPAVVAEHPNPMPLVSRDSDFVWDQLIQTVNDFGFKVERENRMQNFGSQQTIGQIETYPKIGSSWLEPWGRDSTAGYEKWHATIQTVQRKVVIQVTPLAGNFQVEVIVLKELEDLQGRGVQSAGESIKRYDGSIYRKEDDPFAFGFTQGWIPMGRDHSLEQEMLRQIHARLNATVPISSPSLGY
ncbi:MAG: hypothetical protein MPJ24_07320 [Pirellulaceae bacterium]|nr:hypothetical protein [Pirellulaceae bacterium]